MPATYPAKTVLPITEGSERVPRTGRVVDIDGDGVARVRKMHADKNDFNVVHSGVTAAKQATFLAFVAARAADNAAFTFYWLDGAPYTVQFDEPPYNETQLGAGLVTYTVHMKASEV